MAQYKIESYVYLPLGTTSTEAEKLLNSRFSNVSIAKIENRDTEVAVDFNVILERDSEEIAEGDFLEKLKGYDVDNYVVNEY